MLPQKIAGGRRDYAFRTHPDLRYARRNGALRIAHTQNILSGKVYMFRFAVLHFDTSGS
jgi:hypothetical protein